MLLGNTSFFEFCVHENHNSQKSSVVFTERNLPSLPRIIIIAVIIIIISYMQDIYIYIPETNYVPWEYSVAAILLLLFMVLISLVPVLNLL